MNERRYKVAFQYVLEGKAGAERTDIIVAHNEEAASAQCKKMWAAWPMEVKVISVTQV